MGPQKRKRGAENSPEGDEGEKGKKKGKKRHGLKISIGIRQGEPDGTLL
jgi:hypothetical protein